VDDQRVWVRWISASEGKKFADTVIEMTSELKKLGPNKLREEWAL
jgi:F420-non-reducing hydrogenase iron-sulfur subunit